MSSPGPDGRIAFVTTDIPIALDDPDRSLYTAALTAVGVDVAHHHWWDRTVDWAAFDLIVVRTPWDYPQRLPEMLAFLDRVEGLGTVRNPVGVIRWNLDKRYLADLADRGVPTVPTTYVTDEDRIGAALTGADADEVVVKPTVSAGSADTGLFATDDPAAADLARTILDAGKTVMVQPAVASVAERGETAVLAFDGRVSHAAGKGPLLALGGGLRGGSYLEAIAARGATADEVAVAERTLDAVASLGTERGWSAPEEPLLYARIDVVTLDDGSAAVLEAELFEPSLFLPTDPDAAHRFAAACLARL